MLIVEYNKYFKKKEDIIVTINAAGKTEISLQKPKKKRIKDRTSFL